MEFPSDPRKCYISRNKLKCPLVVMGQPGLYRLQGESLALAVEHV